MLTARVSLGRGRRRAVPEAVLARCTASGATPVFGLVVSSVLVSALVLYNWNASFADRFTDVVLLATLDDADRRTPTRRRRS